MKLIYNDENIENEIKGIFSGVDVKFEMVASIEESMKDYKGPPVGTITPEGYLDLGKYLFSFFLGAVSSGIVYDATKETLKKLIKKIKDKSSKDYEFYIISDGEEPNNFNKDTYFFIPIDMDTETAIEEVFEILETLKEFKKLVIIEGSLRIYLQDGKWTLVHLVNPKYSVF